MTSYTKTRHNRYTAFTRRSREDLICLILKALYETTHALTIQHIEYLLFSRRIVEAHIEHLEKVGCVYALSGHYYITDKGRALMWKLQVLREMLGCGRELRVLVYVK